MTLQFFCQYIYYLREFMRTLTKVEAEYQLVFLKILMESIGTANYCDLWHL